MTAKASSLAGGVRPREVWSWAMYDFANSGYTTVVITAVFNAYFVSEVARNAPWATFAWTAALAVSYALVMFVGPAVGAYADAHACKKRLLMGTTLGCVLFTAALAFVGQGDLWLGIGCIVASNFFFGLGENLAAAFLPELAHEDALGRVSGWGWSLGYIGGLVSLGVSLAYITHAQTAGAGAVDFVPATMLLTAGIFALASLPTFVFLRERARPQGTTRYAVKGAFARVTAAMAHARRHPDLARFLLCVVFYQAGIQAVVALAAIYAQEAMGFQTRETIVLIVIVNITAAVGAFAFGHVQDRLGHARTLALTLLGWIVVVLLAWMAESRALFWLTANIVGLCLGASQSAGRALVGYMSPPSRTGEFFGLWGLAVKLSSIIGPVTYGAVTWISGGDHRLAILITGTYFVIGLGILFGLDVGRGRRAAVASEAA